MGLVGNGNRATKVEEKAQFNEYETNGIDNGTDMIYSQKIRSVEVYEHEH